MCVHPECPVMRNAEVLRSKFHPRASNQIWVHSCCSRQKLEAALADSAITAVESDIIMSREGMPIMAHPPATTSDLSFEEFLDTCISDGCRHLKLDFKAGAAVEPCLNVLAKRATELRANGQAVWLNADVICGPNARKRGATIPAHKFIPLCQRLCPFALFSFGWRVAPFGPEEAYSHDDAYEMVRRHRKCRAGNAQVVPVQRTWLVGPLGRARLCLSSGSQWCQSRSLRLGSIYDDVACSCASCGLVSWLRLLHPPTTHTLPPYIQLAARVSLSLCSQERLCAEYGIRGSDVVFCASVRLSELALPVLVNLLRNVPDSQILFWTGFGEMPIREASVRSIRAALAAAGLLDRIGFDVQLCKTATQHAQSHVVDMSFFCSRWVRWVCCVNRPHRPQSGECQPLVDGSCSPAAHQPTKAAFVGLESV
uniref:Menorin-like domain-containing protein n=1 Tax=Chrysotila carterae TaxID=13221 RepID=A0A7S4EWY6_CHRCT